MSQHDPQSNAASANSPAVQPATEAPVDAAPWQEVAATADFTPGSMRGFVVGVAVVAVVVVGASGCLSVEGVATATAAARSG